jgi:hypothetical protein
MATAMVEPSSADIAPPEPVVDNVATLPDESSVPPAEAAALGGPLVDSAPAAEVLSDGAAATDISASAKAKLIGELQALKKRPGVAPAAGGNDSCPEGSLEPQCIASAE